MLSLLFWRAIKESGASQRTALSLAALLSLLYAFSDEFHQRFVTGRTSSLKDVGIDLAGIAAATALATYMLRRPRPHPG